MTLLKADVKKWIEGTKLFDSKDYSGCIQTLQGANPSSKLCFTLGMAYYNMNNPSDALYYFTQSTEFDTFLSIGYFMCGVCRLNTGDTDGAYWDFTSALEKMREHEFIDYTQLKMTYRLLRSEILFNLALSLISGGRDATGPLTEARNCKEVHDELKGEFNTGIQRMSSGQANGLKPLAVDKTKVFQPPKVTDMGGTPKPKVTPVDGGSSGGGGGGGSGNIPTQSPSMQKMNSSPSMIPNRNNSNMGGGGGGGYSSSPSNSGYSSPSMNSGMGAPRQVPTRSLPPAPTPGGNRPSPSPGGGGGNNRPSPNPISSPSPSFRSPGMGGGGNPRTQGGGLMSSNSSPSLTPMGMGRGPTAVSRVPMNNTSPLTPPNRTRGPGPGPVPSRMGNNNMSTPPQEMLRIKCYYKDKRLVEVPKDGPTFFDVKSRVEAKFAATNLILKYLSSYGDITTISNQKDLDDALADNLTDLYVNRPGETNQFEPQSNNSNNNNSSNSNANSNGNGNEWQECYTDEGDVYYYNTVTQESSWDKPPSLNRQSTGSNFNSAKKTSGGGNYPSFGNYGGNNNTTTNNNLGPPKPNLKSDWMECWTETGDKYYYNSKTDESSWDPR